MGHAVVAGSLGFAGMAGFQMDRWAKAECLPKARENLKEGRVK